MEKVKKIIPLVLIFLLLKNCGYAPIYGKNQKIDFYIANLVFIENDFELSNFIKTSLNNYSKKNNGKKFDVNALVNYEKSTISKNSTGNTEEFELYCLVKFTVIFKDIKKEIKIEEKFKMNNFNDDFEEKQYERTIKKNMARSITSKLILQLSRFNAN